jgi:hypothetical protein
MDKKTKRKIAKYLLDIQKRLRLIDWELFIHDDPPEEDGIAAKVDPTEGRKHAVLYFSSNFMSRDPEDQRGIIVHELLHLHHIPASDIIRLDLWDSRCISNDAYKIVFGAFKRQMEYCVDGITDAIAPLFPLPKWS